jgi:tRNA(Ile2) C34 agmatinyltransferase TiaS
MELSERARKTRREYYRKRYGNLTSEAKERMSRYQRKWKQENRDKIRQYNVEYWERKTSVTESVTDNKTSVTAVTNEGNVTTCIECGKEFSKKGNAKFCCNACKQRFYRKNKKSK